MTVTFRAPDKNEVIQQLEIRPFDDEQVVALARSVRTATGQVNGKILMQILRNNLARGCESTLARYSNAICKRFLDVTIRPIDGEGKEESAIEFETAHLGIVARHTLRRPSALECFEIVGVARSGCPPAVPHRQWINHRALNHLWRRFHRQTTGYEGREIPLIVRSVVISQAGKIACEAYAGGVNWNPK